MVHAGYVFVAGIHQSRTWMSRSFEPVQWSACVHRLDFSLYSHPKEFWGNEVRAHVISKGKISSTGKKNSPLRRIEHMTLHQAGQQAWRTTNELFWPRSVRSKWGKLWMLLGRSATNNQSVPVNRLVGLVVKASVSRAEGPRFKSRLRRDFFGAESYQWLKHWHSSGYPARLLAL